MHTSTTAGHVCTLWDLNYSMYCTIIHHLHCKTKCSPWLPHAAAHALLPVRRSCVYTLECAEFLTWLGVAIVCHKWDRWLKLMTLLLGNYSHEEPGFPVGHLYHYLHTM